VAKKRSGIVIPPGESSTIDVAFSSGVAQGPNANVNKKVLVYSNDSTAQVTQLRIKAVMNCETPILVASPMIADFDTILVGSKPSKIIKLKNINATQSTLVVIEKPSPEMATTEIGNTILKPGEFTQIKFSLSGMIEPGLFYTSLTLETANKPGSSRISIPLKAFIRDKTAQDGNKLGQ